MLQTLNSSGQTDLFPFDPATGSTSDIDAGLITVGDIGDYVWLDQDQDGIQDNSESGIENVQVVLYDETNMVGIDTVYTASDGSYLFEDIPAGDYSIIFDPDTNTNGVDFGFTIAGVGNGTNDSDPDPMTNQTAAFTFVDNEEVVVTNAVEDRIAGLGIEAGLLTRVGPIKFTSEYNLNSNQINFSLLLGYQF